MSDPIPEGYLSLVEAWELYRHKFPGNGDPESFIAPFANDELRAFVRMPGSTENFRLASGSWAEQFFAERVFLSPEIVLMPEDDPWGAFVGRTPFVSEGAFHHWLDRRLPARSTLTSSRVERLRSPTQEYPETELRRWAAGYFRDGEAGRAGKRDSDFFEAANAKFPGASSVVLRRHWGSRPETQGWPKKRPGRKRQGGIRTK